MYTVMWNYNYTAPMVNYRIFCGCWNYCVGTGIYCEYTNIYFLLQESRLVDQLRNEENIKDGISKQGCIQKFCHGGYEKRGGGGGSSCP